MSFLDESNLLRINGKQIELKDFKKIWEEAINEKLASVSEQKYFSVMEIVSENEMNYDILKIFNKLIPNLLKCSAKELIMLILNKPPRFDNRNEELLDSNKTLFLKSFEAYKEFIISLLSFDCSYLVKTVNFVLNEALKLFSTSVSENISLKIGTDNVFESIEDIQKRSRAILQGSTKTEMTLITNHSDEDFIRELLKTHPNASEKGISGNDNL